MRGCDAVAPIRTRSRTAPVRWSLLLHPEELGRPSKVGLYNECLVRPNSDFDFVDTFLSKHAVRGGQRLFRLTYQSWASRFQLAGLAVGLQNMGPPVLYMLRHGGASHYAHNQVPLLEVKKLARWSADSSLRRYEKGGRLPQMHALLTASQKCFAQKLMPHIGEILAGTLPPMPEPMDLSH